MTNKTLNWIAFDLGAAAVDMSTMSLIDRGIYISLLTRCGVRGFLETDIEILRRACGGTQKNVPNIKRVLEEFFIEGNGCWLHKMVLDSQNTRDAKATKAKSPYYSKADTYTDRQTEHTGQTDKPTNQQTERLTVETLKQRNSMFA